MTAGFSEIKITGLDERASGPSEKGAAMMRMVLNLSSPAPSEWSDCFNSMWKQHLYGSKRSAHAAGKQITIDCVPSELGPDHLPELKKVVSEANAAYEAHLNQKRSEEEAAEVKRTADSALLAELGKTLRFD